MTKLKTLLLLVLAGFILVACGSGEEAVEAEVVDPRADDKKMLVDMLILNQDLTRDQSECAVNALSGEMDDKAWEALILSVTGTYEEQQAFEDSVSKEEERDLEKQVMSGMAATLECDGVDKSMF